MNISPPTASKILLSFSNEDLLLMEKDRNYIYYYANKKSRLFIHLSRIYWEIKLNGVLNYLDKNFIVHGLVLFGSLSKAEVKIGSDIDLCVFAHEKNINLRIFGNKLKRKIQLFF